MFVFIRFYGSEKHCHAYQLAAEQMAQYGCMLRVGRTHARTHARSHAWFHALRFFEECVLGGGDSNNPDDSMRSVNGRSAGTAASFALCFLLCCSFPFPRFLYFLFFPTTSLPVVLPDFFSVSKFPFLLILLFSPTSLSLTLLYLLPYFFSPYFLFPPFPFPPFSLLSFLSPCLLSFPLLSSH